MDNVGKHHYSSFGAVQAGVLLIQPCRSVFLHMRALLEHNDISAFTRDFAEQTFLDWYWRFDGMRLGYEYNFIASAVKKYEPRVVGSLRNKRRRGDEGVASSEKEKEKEKEH